MEGLSKRRALEHLRARIESIEKRPLLADAQPRVGEQSSDKLAFAVPGGVVHEVFSDTQHNTGATLGFALATARGLLAADRPAIIVMQLVRDSRDLGLPYGAGLGSFGLDPDSVVLCRPETPIELLWAIEESISCRAVAAVVADIGHEVKTLDFTASRRLSLRAAAGGSTVFLVRYGREREASAARFRWRITPSVSGEVPFDARAPGRARWHVHLEKGRLGSKRDPAEWVLDWTENGFALVDRQRIPTVFPTAGAPLPSALPAALGDRLSQTG